MDNALPTPEGLDAFKVEQAKKLAVGLTCKTLSQLRGGYEFFNHGLVFDAGHLDKDPLQDYWIRNDLPAKDFPQKYEHSMPLFGGWDSSLSHMLFIVKKEYWQGLYDYLRAITVIDWTNHYYWKAVVGLASIPDPTIQPRQPDAHGTITLEALPSPLPVWLVQVHRDDATFKFWQGINDPTWRVIMENPDPDVIRVASAIFAESSTPLRAIEPTEFKHELPKIEVHDLPGHTES